MYLNGDIPPSFNSTTQRYNYSLSSVVIEANNNNNIDEKQLIAFSNHSLSTHHNKPEHACLLTHPLLALSPPAENSHQYGINLRAYCMKV